MKNVFLLIILSTLLFGLSGKVYSQSFEGKIVYQRDLVNANPEKISEEEFKLYFANPNATSILYLKQNRYKLVTLKGKENKPHTVNFYDPDSRMAIQFMYWDSKTYQETIVDQYLQKKMTVTENISDTIIVLGHKCHSITITTSIKPLRTTTVYFSKDYELEVKYLENDTYKFLKYIYESGALPLKIIKSGKGVFYNEVFTAVKISNESLKVETFKHPSLKSFKNVTF